MIVRRTACRRALNCNPTRAEYKCQEQYEFSCGHKEGLRQSIESDDFSGTGYREGNLVQSEPESRPWVYGLCCKAVRGEKLSGLLAVLRRLLTLFESLAVPDPAFPRVAGELEILRQLQGVDGTSVFAEAAEHAAAQVVGEVGE